MSTRPERRRTESIFPQDVEAERRILGIILKYPQKADAVVDKLRDVHFFDPSNRLIYQIILRLYTASGRVSYTQVFNSLRKEGALPNPEQALLALTESFVSRAELEPSIDAVIDAFAKRRLLTAAEQLEQLVLAGPEEATRDLLARAQQIIFEATNLAGAQNDIKSLADVLVRCYTNLADRKDGKTESFGLTVQYPAIDALTTGFKKKDLVILAARPSMGKTSLALNMAANIAKRQKPVLIFSLEMDDEQIGDRLVLGECFRFRGPNGQLEITPEDYAARIDEAKFNKLGSVFNDLYNLPVRIVDRRGLSATEIRAKARQVKQELPNLSMIIIDYLQLIQPPSDAQKNYALVVGDMVRELRDLAGELDLPIVLLSQLNRSLEQRPEKRPLLSDLRDSGNIEEFADIVMFIYRDEYYHRDEAEARGTKGKAEVIVAKHRKGKVGTAVLQFVPELTRFIDVTEEEA